MSTADESVKGGNDRSLFQMVYALLVNPYGVWSWLTLQEGRRNFLRYFVPALCLAMAGRLFGQVALGVHLPEFNFQPTVGDVLPNALVTCAILFFMPFVMAKYLSFILRIFGVVREVSAVRAFVVLSYLPTLTLSAFEFIPILSLGYVIATLQGLILTYSGISAYLRVPSRVCALCFFLYVVALIAYLTIFLILGHYIAPNPLWSTLLELGMDS